jgi:hypothetical protein
MLFGPFLVIWAPPIGPKKVNKGPQVGRMYGPMLKLKNKPPKQIIVLEDMVQNNRVFMLFFHFVTICSPLNGPKMVPNGLQVGKMYRPMSKLKNKPLTKSYGPFCKEKWSKTARKHVFYAVFGQVGAIRAPPNGSKKVDKGP